jgi:hypothetical protein
MKRKRREVEAFVKVPNLDVMVMVWPCTTWRRTDRCSQKNLAMLGDRTTLHSKYITWRMEQRRQSSHYSYSLVFVFTSISLSLIYRLPLCQFPFYYCNYLYFCSYLLTHRLYGPLRTLDSFATILTYNFSLCLRLFNFITRKSFSTASIHLNLRLYIFYSTFRLNLSNFLTHPCSIRWNRMTATIS